MFETSLTPPAVDQVTIDRYVAKGRALRSCALRDFFRAIFAAPARTTAASAGKAGCAA